MTVSCVCISPHFKETLHPHKYSIRNTQNYFDLFFSGYTLILIVFKIAWCFFYVTIFVKVVYEKQKHLKDKLQCEHYFIHTLFLQTARTTCEGSVCIFLCQMWLAHNDLFPQSVGLIHVVLMSFQNLFLRSQCFTFWSSHDTLCFSF